MKTRSVIEGLAIIVVFLLTGATVDAKVVCHDDLKFLNTIGEDNGYVEESN